MSDRILSSISGCILGTAIGDALGLPYEGLSPLRAKRMLGDPDRFRFCFGRGMVSDDTEHTCMVAQCLAASKGNVADFEILLARSFRYWLLALPAGIGLATLRAILKLWLGFSPPRSGVFSAGNGPAMRAAILGVAIDDLGQLQDFVRASTQITHTDPQAEFGAFAIALAAHLASREVEVSADQYANILKSHLGADADDLHMHIAQVIQSINQSQSTPSFAASSGLANGVTG